MLLFRHSGQFWSFGAFFGHFGHFLANFGPKLKLVVNWSCDHSKWSQEKQKSNGDCFGCHFLDIQTMFGHLGPSFGHFWPCFGRILPEIQNVTDVKVPSQTISIRFLLVSRSIWVVTWPIFDNLEFWAKFCKKRPKMAEKGPKWQKMVWISDKWHSKPSPSDFCSSCDCFEWSYDQFMTILTLGPKLAKNGRKRPRMTEHGLNI